MSESNEETVLTGQNNGAETGDEEKTATEKGAEKTEAKTPGDGDEAKAGADKGADEGKAADEESETKAGEDEKGAPDSYDDFELPEGIDPDTEALEGATEMFKELNLSQEQAQKVVSFYAEQVQKQAEQQVSQWRDTLSGWETTAKEDEEIGGDAFDEHVNTAKAVLKTYGTEDLVKAMNTYGFGNHPEVIRVLSRVGKAMEPHGLLAKEDGVVNGTPVQSQKTRAERMFPSMQSAG